jgi:NMT1/THI5 like protein
MLWRVSFIVLLLLALIGPSPTRIEARMVVGVSTVNVAFLPVYLTQDKGFFKDEGLDVLVVMFNAGATNLQAIIGGDVQIMAGGVPETVLARASGVDIKIFGRSPILCHFKSMEVRGSNHSSKAKGKNSPSAGLAHYRNFSRARHYVSPVSILERSPCCRLARLRRDSRHWRAASSMRRFCGFQ